MALENALEPVSGRDCRIASLSFLVTILYLAVALRCFFPIRWTSSTWSVYEYIGQRQGNVDHLLTGSSYITKATVEDREQLLFSLLRLWCFSQSHLPKVASAKEVLVQCKLGGAGNLAIVAGKEVNSSLSGGDRLSIFIHIGESSKVSTNKPYHFKM